jgi:hypothetical protein
MKIDLSNTREAKKTNKKLGEMIVDIERLYRALQSQNTVIKPELVKMLYKAPNDRPEDQQSTEDNIPQQVTLLEHTDTLLAKWQEEVDQGARSKGTQRHWLGQ